jgi:diacylglycerol kinase family enzyme
MVVRSLAGLVDLEVEKTQYRGHARELAEKARTDVVIVLGGDGSINEVVNGLMSRAGPRPPIAIIPGGGGNVLARALGVPLDAAKAIRRLREVIESGRYRTIGLGLAGDRYFTFSAGLGMDAEVVGEVERLRSKGRRESASLFLRTMVRFYYRGTDRRHPALTLERDGEPPAGNIFLTIVTNRSPWTYLRGRALLPVPGPDFSSGLDVLALRQVRLGTILYLVGQMLWVRKGGARARSVLSVQGEKTLTVRSARPIAFQVDGDYLGETAVVQFHFVADALQVVA